MTHGKDTYPVETRCIASLILTGYRRFPPERAAIGNNIDPRRNSQPRRTGRDSRQADERPGEAVDIHGGRIGAAVRDDEGAGGGVNLQAGGDGCVVRGAGFAVRDGERDPDVLPDADDDGRVAAVRVRCDPDAGGVRAAGRRAVRLYLRGRCRLRRRRRASA
jgi:hypothetical protein